MTLISAAIIIAFTTIEFLDYRRVNIDTSILVDRSRGEKLNVRMNITFPRVPCYRECNYAFWFPWTAQAFSKCEKLVPWSILATSEVPVFAERVSLSSVHLYPRFMAVRITLRCVMFNRLLAANAYTQYSV